MGHSDSVGTMSELACLEWDFDHEADASAQVPAESAAPEFVSPGGSLPGLANMGVENDAGSKGSGKNKVVQRNGCYRILARLFSVHTNLTRL